MICVVDRLPRAPLGVNSETVPVTSTSWPTAMVGGEFVSTKMPSEVAALPSPVAILDVVAAAAVGVRHDDDAAHRHGLADEGRGVADAWMVPMSGSALASSTVSVPGTSFGGQHQRVAGRAVGRARWS